MNKINIFSDHEFLIEINYKNYIIDNLNSLEITDLDQPIFAKIYPINQSKLSLPFCVKLYSKNNDIFCNSEFCKIYKLKNRCDIFISPFLISSNDCLYSQTHTIKNIKYSVCCYADKIIINGKTQHLYNVDAKEFSSTTENNNIFILCKHTKKHLVVFNCITNKFFEIYGDQIEIENNSIKSLLNLNDIAKHTIVCSYKVNDSIELLSTDLYTQTPTHQKPATKEICIYAFFEALKANNIKLATSYLHNDLKNIITDNSLKSYFGDFEKLKLNNLTPLTYTLYSFNQAKDYIFSFKDNLICEIDEA